MDEEPLAESSVTIPSCPEHLPRVRDVIEITAAQVGFPVEDVHRIVTAAFEAAVNAATHGSPLGSKNRITVDIRVYSDKLVVEVKDQGHGFQNNTERKMPGITAPRGRGIPLMRTLVDDVRFLNEDGGRVILTTYRNHGRKDDQAS